MNIPVILRWKGHIPEGGRIETVHSPIDHLRTLTALAGLPPASEVDGRDLSPAILGDQVIDRGGVLMGNYTSHYSDQIGPRSTQDWAHANSRL